MMTERERESPEREQIYPLSLEPHLMFHLIGMFTLTAFASSLILSPSFCHMMKSCRDEECMRLGGSWLAFKKKKTGNENYHSTDHVSALYVFVVVTCMRNQCMFACRLPVDLFYLCLISIVDAS